MKLTITRAALLAAMTTANRVVERRNTIPILANALLSAENGRLTIKATDLDIEATIGVAAEIEQPGAVTVPASMLHDIAKKLPDDATIALELQDASLTIRAGRSRFKLQTLPADDFPDIAHGEFGHSFTTSGKVLARLIAKSSFAISSEETRYYLNGIFLHVVEHDGHQVLRAVATDGHRLARIGTPAPKGSQGMPGIIVPKKTVGELARMAEAAGDAELAIDVSTSKIRVRIGDTVLTSKLIDGTFPDYQRVIPALNDKRAVVDCAGLARALGLVGTVSTAGSRAMKFTFADGSLKLSTRNADTGDGEQELDAEWEHGAFEIGFNGGYAEALLSALATDTVAISLNDPQHPSIWEEARERPEGNQPNALYVLMPMRV